jgi:hypothetical protein
MKAVRFIMFGIASGFLTLCCVANTNSHRADKENATQSRFVLEYNDSDLFDRYRFVVIEKKKGGVLQIYTNDTFLAAEVALGKDAIEREDKSRIASNMKVSVRSLRNVNVTISLLIMRSPAQRFLTLSGKRRDRDVTMFRLLDLRGTGFFDVIETNFRLDASLSDALHALETGGRLPDETYYMEGLFKDPSTKTWNNLEYSNDVQRISIQTNYFGY